MPKGSERSEWASLGWKNRKIEQRKRRELAKWALSSGTEQSDQCKELSEQCETDWASDRVARFKTWLAACRNTVRPVLLFRAPQFPYSFVSLPVCFPTMWYFTSVSVFVVVCLCFWERQRTSISLYTAMSVGLSVSSRRNFFFLFVFFGLFVSLCLLVSFFVCVLCEW